MLSVSPSGTDPYLGEYGSCGKPTEFIYHSGCSSNCKWHIKTEPFWHYDWLPQKPKRPFSGAQLWSSYVLLQGWNRLQWDWNEEVYKHMVCLQKGILQKTWVKREWKMRKSGGEEIWEENKTGIFEKSNFMLHNLHILPSFPFTFNLDSAIWRRPCCIVSNRLRIQSWALPRARRS